MKKLLTLLGFVIFGWSECFTQAHNNHSVYGYSESGNPYDVPNGYLMDFTNGYPRFIVQNIRQEYNGYCALCSDSIGNLLFHTNGRAIRNRLHQIMENGDEINPGEIWWAVPNGYPSVTGGFVLPAPAKNNHYFLIHTSLENDLLFPYFPLVYYSLIDMNQNNGLGKVIEKNVKIAEGELPSPVAIKHGNGRDWWLIIGDYISKSYKTYLVDPNGIQHVTDQPITPDAFTSPGGGYHLASPDGRFFVNNDTYTGLWMYDFDRCSGTLSNPRLLPYQPPTFYTSTNAFSADSRFLYLGTDILVYQLDMQTIGNSEVTMDTIARYDGGANPSPPWFTFFLLPELASNDKIYYQTLNTTRVFHTIHAPQLPLLASDYTQRSLVAPHYKGLTRCYFPSYRLGRELDAPCDTLPFSGSAEDRFQHFPWQPKERSNSEEITILKLPAHFKIPPQPLGPLPEDFNPLSPLNLTRRAMQRGHLPVNFKENEKH
jgi:hypothetical protein